MTADTREPVGVVMFGSGPVLTHDARRFLARLEAHPDIDLLGAFCQAEGASVAHVWRDLRRRRGTLALPLFVAWFGNELLRRLRHPRAERALRRELARIDDRIHWVQDVHAPEVVARIEALEPDLGLIYGSPILKPAVFEAPRLGTLGIHHGKLPEYRGNKTTFWSMRNGEATAGVTIQKIEAGLDTGQIVEEGEVGIGRRSLGAVWRDLENLGLALYMRAIVSVARGRASLRPQAGPRHALYRNPSPADLVRFHWQRARVRLGLLGSTRARPTARPRVLIFTETYQPVVGGGETQARLLAEELLAAGIPTRVLTRRSDPELPRVEHVGELAIHRIGPAGSGQLKKWGLVVTGIPALIRLRSEFDLVYVSGFRIIGIVAVPLCRLLGKRVVLKADSQGEMSGAFFANGLARVRMRPESLPFRTFLSARNRLLRSADAFVAITEGIVDELRDAGVDMSKVRRIPNAVDTSRFRPAAAGERLACRSALDLPESDPIVVYTGRLVSYKGLPLLVRVWSDLHRDHPDARLLLIGTGGLDIHNCEDELRATVAASGLADHVVFAGSTDDVAPYLQAADLFVLPSEDEALPCSLLEAMACALACVSTPVGAIPRIVEDGVNGRLVAPGQAEPLRGALDQLLGDPESRAELGAAARATITGRYSAQPVTEELRSVFQQCLASTTEGESADRGEA
jgi:glycosyltransferase involved in cell wall biosynthesis/folate-dependent phosphoribosylglycinamide formyltransferase PurN